VAGAAAPSAKSIWCNVKAAPEKAVPVVISADKAIKYETVVKVMDNLQKAGVSRVGLSVQTGK